MQWSCIVTYRIDSSSGTGGLALRVMGRLDAQGADQLRDLCRERSGSGALTIDLDGLASADAAALAVLRSLQEHGARLVRASRYIRLLLDGATDTEADRDDVAAMEGE